MEKRTWLVAHLPGDALRVSRFAQQHPRADVQLMHLGLEHQRGQSVHRILLSLRGDKKAWGQLRSFFVDDVRVAWQDLPRGENDALLGFTSETNVGDNTRFLLSLWPNASVSVLRCRDGRTDLYVLAAHDEAADSLREALHERFDPVGVEVRDLDSEERTWFRRMLQNPVLMAAMNR